jgi:chromosomal replication initiation ATPase DnaA
MNKIKTLLDEILDIISKVTGVDKNLIISKNRAKEVADSRRMTVFILRKFGYSLKFIGKLLNLDHTGVLYLIRTHEDALYCKKYKRDFEIIKQKLEL